MGQEQLRSFGPTWSWGPVTESGAQVLSHQDPGEGRTTLDYFILGWRPLGSRYSGYWGNDSKT